MHFLLAKFTFTKSFGGQEDKIGNFQIDVRSIIFGCISARSTLGCSSMTGLIPSY